MSGVNGSYVLDAVRTPIGRHGGALAGVRPDDLAAHIVKSLVERSPNVDPAEIEDVYFGDANGAGEDNRDVARMAVLLAGLPTSIPGATVNRLCGSGLEAAIDASRAVSVGDNSLLIAGGVESMTRAPWVMLKPDKPYPRAHETLHSTTLGWRMTNPNMPEQWTVALGEGAEILADRFEISREEQDEFALKSHQRAAAAWDKGVYEGEIAPVPDIDLDRDEGIRPDSSLEKLAKLKPVFDRKYGTVTAGNASPLTDGGAAVLLMSEERAKSLGLTPLAYIRSYAYAAIDPGEQLLQAPVFAAPMALKRAGLTLKDIDLVEMHEAFAAQVLSNLQGFESQYWAERGGFSSPVGAVDRSRLNVMGGSISIGHPFGATGARITTTLVNELARRGGQFGLMTVCAAGGMGFSMVVERA